MAIDLPEVHARAVLDTTRAIVAAIGPDQWALPSECSDWDVRALTNHVVSGNFWASPLVAGDTIEAVGHRLDGDLLDDDPLGVYDASAAEAAMAFRAPGAMERMVAVSYGPVPGAVYCGHRFVDVLIHGWDLAKSTGQDTTLPQDLIEACWEVVLPQRDVLTGSGMFGHERSISPDADRQTQLLAILGREA
jgi:uncharacterized protein (TIGR03086 family)